MTDVNVSNPLTGPYRTGAYLVSDVGPDNFRNAATLPENPYRASGSHQLGLADFVRVLNPIVQEFSPTVLHLVDLREETHGFFDGAPVSWYADNDFANVGQTKEWIADFEGLLLNIHKGRWTELFVIEDDASDDRDQERVTPVSLTSVKPLSVRTEADVADVLSNVFAPTRVEYHRIPVTDHCAPTDKALYELQHLGGLGRTEDWVHFHCHGGDGRTTTFLALYDMLCQKLNGSKLPALDVFADRQCELSNYNLDPTGGSCGKPTTGWKLTLEQARWSVLADFLAWLENPSRRSIIGAAGGE